MSSSDRVVVVVAHGSRAASANDEVVEIAALVAAELGDAHVVVAYLELAEPDVMTAIETAVAGGAREVIVHPYFLGSGRHAREDVPRVVAEAQRHYPRVTIRATPALGVHPLLARLVATRVREATSNDEDR